MFEIACVSKVICMHRSLEMEIKANFMVQVLWGNQIMEFAKSLVKQRDRDPRLQLLTAVAAAVLAVLFCVLSFSLVCLQNLFRAKDPDGI